jgi:Tripartite tricarboxylate transporter family receptor
MGVGAVRTALHHRRSARGGWQPRYRDGRQGADGHTLLLVTIQSAVKATLYDTLNYNFIRDIAPVASISRQTPALEVAPSFLAKNVPDFIASLYFTVCCPDRTFAVRDDHNHGIRADLGTLCVRPVAGRHSSRVEGAATLQRQGVLYVLENGFCRVGEQSFP